MTTAAKSPEDVARAVLQRFHVTGPVDLCELASKIGLSVKEVDVRDFEGALVRVPNKPSGIVAVKRDIREEGRKRFTIAHEFGHYLLPGHGMFERTCTSENIESASRRVPSHEAAANLFASELLLPAAQVRPIVRSKLASIETAEFLASEFETSLTAALLKCVALTDERCCVVMSRNQIIEWAKPNELFKHFISRRERLSSDCLAIALMIRNRESRASGLISADVWLEDSHLMVGVRIYEDSIFQPYYNRVLTVLTIHEPLSDSHIDDEDSLLDDLDPDEFTIHRRRWPGRR